MSDADELLSRSRRGDPRATDALFCGFFERLLPLARRRISPRLARRFDAEDIVQAVFCRFFARPKPQWNTLDYEALFLLFARMTVCRTLKQVTYECAGKRDPLRERAIEEAMRAAPEPPPDAAATFADEVNHFLMQLLPPDRDVLVMRLAGCSTPEIAAALGTYDRKLRRAFERIRAVADGVFAAV
jgi:RNA polymerase sigma factor (sigma-70 family)